MVFGERTVATTWELTPKSFSGVNTPLAPTNKLVFEGLAQFQSSLFSTTPPIITFTNSFSEYSLSVIPTVGAPSMVDK